MYKRNKEITLVKISLDKPFALVKDYISVYFIDQFGSMSAEVAIDDIYEDAWSSSAIVELFMGKDLLATLEQQGTVCLYSDEAPELELLDYHSLSSLGNTLVSK